MVGGGKGWGSDCLGWRSGSSLCTYPPPLRKKECSCQCDDFQIPCYVLTTGPKTYQNPSFNDAVIDHSLLSTGNS